MQVELYRQADLQWLDCAHQLAEIAKPAGVDAEDGLLIECL